MDLTPPVTLASSPKRMEAIEKDPEDRTTMATSSKSTKRGFAGDEKSGSLRADYIIMRN